MAQVIIEFLLGCFQKRYQFLNYKTYVVISLSKITALIVSCIYLLFNDRSDILHILSTIPNDIYSANMIMPTLVNLCLEKTRLLKIKIMIYLIKAKSCINVTFISICFDVYKKKYSYN